jgi:hypothetical protein
MFMSHAPYAEAAGRLFQYSSLDEPLARNRCIAPAINEAMETTRNFGQSFSATPTRSAAQGSPPRDLYETVRASNQRNE